MSKLSLAVVVAVLLSMASPALAHKPTAMAFSVANAWDGRANCMQPVSAGHASSQDRLSFMRTRYGYNGAGASGWTAGELDEVLAVLSDLPANAAPFDDEVLRPLVFDAHLAPSASGQALVGSTAIIALDDADGIRVGSAWKTLPQSARRVAIFHELAHEFLRQRGAYFDWQSHWNAAVRADEAFARKQGLNTDRVSLYAATNMAEDFAESAAAYRYMPARLKQRAPARYKLLKTWMFDGLEYVTAQACAPEAAKSERAAKLAGPAPTRRAQLDAFKVAWRTLSPQGQAPDTAALEGLLNSQRFGQKLAGVRMP